MIKSYYTEAQAYDEIDSLLFTIKCVDEDMFELDMKTVLSNGNIDEVLMEVKELIRQMSKVALERVNVVKGSEE
jgi:hypothetical protein